MVLLPGTAMFVSEWGPLGGCFCAPHSPPSAGCWRPAGRGLQPERRAGHAGLYLPGTGGVGGRAGGPRVAARSPCCLAGSLACLKNCVGFTAGPVRPSAEQFHQYLPWFLSDPPNVRCPKG